MHLDAYQNQHHDISWQGSCAELGIDVSNGVFRLAIHSQMLLYILHRFQVILALSLYNHSCEKRNRRCQHALTLFR